MTISVSNHSVYYRYLQEKTIILVIYVDDLIIISDDAEGISALKKFFILPTWASSRRRDGLESNEADSLNNIPQFSFTLAQLESSFSVKGLSVEDMVILSGAHSIGIAHYSSFTNRLYSTVLLTSDQDLTNSTSALSLVKIFSQGGSWAPRFAASMQKMGQIGVLTGTEGNIRLNCSVFNS
ncbi:Peroxidase 2-like protein [Drosera capensis]